MVHVDTRPHGFMPNLAALTYVALKPLKVGDSTRMPGELVPEAAHWRNVTNYVNAGFLAIISDNSAQRKGTYGKAEGTPGKERTRPVDPYTAQSKRPADAPRLPPGPPPT